MPDQKLTRREFLHGAAGAAFAGGAVALGGRAGLSFNPNRLTRSASTTKALNYAMSSDIETSDIADPTLSNSEHDGRLMALCYEQLTQYSDSLSAVPWLAESWSSNATGTEWTFQLRKGVKFQGGTTFTANDVVYTFQRILDPTVASAAAALIGVSLDPDGVSAVNDYTVRFKLKSADGDWPLSIITKQSYIVPVGATSADMRTNAVGTGAFLLKEFIPGSNPTVFAKNPNYWQPGLPKSDIVNLISVVNDESRLAGLQRGQLNIIEDPLFTSLKSLPSEGLKVVAAHKGTMELICLHVKTPPFDDVRVLTAMKYALDRPQMLELLLLGNGITIDDIPTYPSEQYGPTQAPRAHNVAMAKQLLSEAGYPKGITLDCHTSNAEARLVNFCTAYKGMAAEAGIDVNVIIDPPTTYYSNVWNKVSMFADSWIARPVPGMLSLLFLPGSSNNETQWDNPQWTETFVKATGSVNPVERQTLFRQCQTQIINEGGNLVPYMGFATTATSGNVIGWRPSGDILEGSNLVYSTFS